MPAPSGRNDRAMLTHFGVLAGAALACAAAVAALTGPVRAWLIQAGVHDAPNARSSHTVEKPRGGGLAVLAVLLPAWLVAGWLGSGSPPLALVGLTAAVAGVSFVDDVVGVSAGLRFLAQAAAVLAGLAWLDPAPMLPGWLPVWLERAGIALAWLWFVNLYNFMDGIDGITGMETGVVAFGVGLVGLLLGVGAADIAPAWLLAGAAAGFLWWNWAPSRIFLGDVGSVPIGFAVGWLLIDVAAAGALAAALILPGYYLLDATLTLLLRLLRGDKVWRAHKEHAYQRAVQRGLSHDAVAGRIAGVNLVLVGCAAWTVHGRPGVAVAVAVLVVSALWVDLRFGLRAAARG